MATVEGSCSGQHGFVVAVTDVIEIGKGRIREGGHNPHWLTRFSAHPCHLCRGFLPTWPPNSPLCWIVPGGGLATFPIKYNAVVFRPFKGEVFDAVVTVVNKLGFFAQVGPLNVFVSKHLIPEDFALDAQVCLSTCAQLSVCFAPLSADSIADDLTGLHPRTRRARRSPTSHRSPTSSLSV